MTYPLLLGSPDQSGPLQEEWSQHLLQGQRYFADRAALICEVASLQKFRAFTTQGRAGWLGEEQRSNCDFIRIISCCRACEFLRPSFLNSSPLLYVLTQSYYTVKALFRPMDSKCLIRATAGGYFFPSPGRGQTSFVGILDPLSPNFVVIINCQEGRLLMALLQWDRTQIYHVWPQHEQVLQGSTSHSFLLFDPSPCFLLPRWPLILSRHHLLPQEPIFISISHCLCSFYRCHLSEFPLSPILGQGKAWSSKINREVQEK